MILGGGNKEKKSAIFAKAKRDLSRGRTPAQMHKVLCAMRTKYVHAPYWLLIAEPAQNYKVRNSAHQ